MLIIQNLCKEYDSHTVLDNMNIEIARGQLFGLVGPNGAGKTTLIKILAGLLEPNQGSILLENELLTTKERRQDRRIAYMPDYFGVYENLKVYEYLDFYGQMYGMPDKMIRSRIDENLELVNLHRQREEFVNHLSRGMKQRLCLARCLIKNPQLILLDEPASGLDVRARNDMQIILKNLQEKQITIIISSHILEELSKVCSHIGIIDQGKVMAQGPVEEILRIEEKSKPLKIRFTEVNSRLLKYLHTHSLISNLVVDGTQATMFFNGDASEEANLLTQMVQDGAKICYFAREDGNLEQIFLKITKGE